MTSKKVKVGEAEEIAQDQLSPQEEAALNKLTQIQEEIEKLNDEATEEILKIEKKYNQKRTPFYARRSEIIKQIPHFWLKAIGNHDSLSDLLTGEDVKVFEFLQEINVEDFNDLSSGFKISFTFAQNPYFKTNKLWKEFRYDKDHVLTVIPSPIEWKSPEKNLVERATKAFQENSPDSSKNKRPHEDTDSSTFFLWFNPEDQDIEVAEIIKEELWPDPMKWFFGMNENDEDEGEEGDYEEVEGEEGEGEEGENGDDEDDDGEEGEEGENGEA